MASSAYDDLLALVSELDESEVIENDYHITTDEELLYFVKETTGIDIPSVQVCEHHSTPARAFCDAYFARSPVSVWWASRAFGGKSFLLGLLGWVEAITLGVDVNILGGSGEQSKRVLEYISDFWASSAAPRHLLASEPAATRQRLRNGAKITALMASQRSVRGAHPTRLREDEIDEMALPILDASSGQTMIKRNVPTQTVYSSTRQYMGGTMDEMLQRAADKGWGVYQWCYKETLEPHGWLSMAEVEQKRSEVPSAMFSAEFDLGEPSPDSRAIQPTAVERMFKKELGEYAGDLHEYIETEEPQPDAIYITGADWARKKDFTEIITFRVDCAPARLIAYERTGRLEWPVMVERFNTRCRRFEGTNHHDGTGIGDVVAGYIDVIAEGVIMVGRARANLLTNFIAAVEHNEIVSPVINALQAEFKFASMADVYGSDATHHLPDGLSAAALAWMGVQFRAMTDEEAERIASGKIDLSHIPDDLLRAARDSGVDLSQFRL